MNQVDAASRRVGASGRMPLLQESISTPEKCTILADHDHEFMVPGLAPAAGFTPLNALSQKDRLTSIKR
jgi:hypothetical protein